MKQVLNLIMVCLTISLAGCYNGGNQTLIPKEKFNPQEIENGYNLRVESKVDILFVIDDSISMDFAQYLLALNVSDFASKMDKNTFLDYHIGAITTTVGTTGIYPNRSGHLQGEPSFVTRKTPNAMKLLSSNIKKIGTGGDTIEKVFDPIYIATNPDLNLNSNFLRSDAFLVLILITDATDQSENISGFRAYNELVNLKAYDRDKILGYGVLSYPTFFNDDCKQDGGGHNNPDNLLEFMTLFTNAYNTKINQNKSVAHLQLFSQKYSKLTNVFSLCDDKFGEKLGDIGNDIRKRVSQKISLPVRPIDGSIKLKYGKQVIDPQWWKYDFSTNSIILDSEVELDENQVDPQLFVSMDEADPLTTIGKPPKDDE